MHLQFSVWFHRIPAYLVHSLQTVQRPTGMLAQTASFSNTPEIRYLKQNRGIQSTFVTLECFPQPYYKKHTNYMSYKSFFGCCYKYTIQTIGHKTASKAVFNEESTPCMP